MMLKNRNKVIVLSLLIILETLLEDSKILMKRISNYGLFNKSFIYSFIEFVLFNYHFVTFLLSVFYLFFLNKT